MRLEVPCNCLYKIYLAGKILFAYHGASILELTIYNLYDS